MGNVTKASFYKRGKHKLYGYKTEDLVWPNGFEVFCTPNYAESIADIDFIEST